MFLKGSYKFYGDGHRDDDHDEYDYDDASNAAAVAAADDDGDLISSVNGWHILLMF